MKSKTYTLFLLGWALLLSQSALCLEPGVEENAQSNPPLIVGLDADMSSGAALGGEAIRRGIIMAIDEINASGGVLGSKLELLVRDHRGIPARGIDNMREFSTLERLLAVVGGVHTPVALAQLEEIHKSKIIYLDPWAAGTPIVDNGYTPNYVFRLSVRDELAGGFLVDEILRMGYRRPALFLEKTGWGRSNLQAMESALSRKGISSGTTQWFHWGTNDFQGLYDEALKAKSDIILLVANAREGVRLVKEIASRSNDQRIPIVSHWGITGGKFFEECKSELKEIELSFLQTYSFYEPRYPEKSRSLANKYFSQFKAKSEDLGEIIAPVGTAHAYDLIHILAKAVRKAGTAERPKVREALENIGGFTGLVREYNPPFSPDRHDALDRSDFRLCGYDENGAIKPIAKEGL